MTFREAPLVDTWTTEGELVGRLALSPGERVVEHRGRRYAVAHEGTDGIPLLTILEVADQKGGSVNGAWVLDRSPR